MIISGGTKKREKEHKGTCFDKDVEIRGERTKREGEMSIPTRIVPSMPGRQKMTFGRKEKKVELTNFDKALERTIFVNFYPSFKEVHKHLRENLFNGIVLVGGVEI